MLEKLCNLSRRLSLEQLFRYSMLPMNVPQPVMSLAIMAKSREASGNFSKALSRFTREDPTFKVALSLQSQPWIKPPDSQPPDIESMLQLVAGELPQHYPAPDESRGTHSLRGLICIVGRAIFKVWQN